MRNLLDVSAMLHNYMANGKGASLAMRDGSKPHTGYMVSLRGYEMQSAVLPTRNMILAWAEAVTMRQVEHGHSLYWGCWIDDGRYYLDVSVNIPDQIEALKLAEANGQLAVYDVEADESVVVEDKRVRCDKDQERCPQYPAYVKPH